MMTESIIALPHPRADHPRIIVDVGWAPPTVRVEPEGGGRCTRDWNYNSWKPTHLRAHSRFWEPWSCGRRFRARGLGRGGVGQTSGSIQPGREDRMPEASGIP